jgi:hypothetical protein
MKRTKVSIAAAALLAVACIGLLTRRAKAQDGLEDHNAIVGSWRVQVDVTNPPGMPSFPVLITFHSDGTVIESRLGFIPQGPAGPIVEGAGHGAWQRLGNQIAASFQMLLQGAPGNTILNGAFWATEKINCRPVLGPDSNSFKANWNGTLVDPSGNVILQGAGTMSAVRIQVEP